jgi:hypothetical protein
MSQGDGPPEPILLPEIRRARIDILNIYEISEAELEILERGSPDSIYLNFAIFLLSVALSFVISLSTTTIVSDRIYYAFVLVTAVAAILGAFFLVLWRRNHQSVASVVAAIRKRMPPLGESREIQTIDVSR